MSAIGKAASSYNNGGANGGLPSKILILCDCLGVVQQMRLLISARNDGSLPNCPKWSYEIWMDIFNVLLANPVDMVAVEWIPSHGKRRSWQPDSPLLDSAAQARALNDAADLVAKRGAGAAHDSLNLTSYMAVRNAKTLKCKQLLQKAIIGVYNYIEDNENVHDVMGSHNMWKA